MLAAPIVNPFDLCRPSRPWLFKRLWYESLKLGRTKSFNLPSDQNAMNIKYIGEMILENSFFDGIVPFSFGVADCGKMRGAGS